MIPAEYKPPKSFENTQATGVFKPVFGALGSMHAEFKIHEEYSSGESVRTGREVKRPVEIVMIRSDKFSKVPKRIGDWETGKGSELSRKEQRDLAPLYERFKLQKDSTDTPIFDWEAISDDEKAHLANLGIFTVEQLHNMQEHERYRIGPGWKDMWDCAQRHMVAKNGDPGEERRKEMQLLREENERLAKRDQEREEQYFALQAQIAELQKAGTSKKGPWMKKEETAAATE